MMQDSGSRTTPRSGGSGFMDGLNDAIRQNPVPAALVGVGILWLFAGGRNVMLGRASRSVVNGVGRGAWDAGGAAYRGVRGATESVGRGLGAASESVADMGAETADTVKDVAGSIGSAVNRASEFVGDSMSRATNWWSSDDEGSMPRQSSNSAGAFSSAQEALADLFARQPLMLGAVGVAIGAAIAASLPSSDGENRLLGETADAVKDQAGKLWDETKRRGADLASKGLKEAEAQGLTPEAAARAARTVASKVAGFAENAGSDIVNRTTR